MTQTPSAGRTPQPPDLGAAPRQAMCRPRLPPASACFAAETPIGAHADRAALPPSEWWLVHGLWYHIPPLFDQTHVDEDRPERQRHHSSYAAWAQTTHCIRFPPGDSASRSDGKCSVGRPQAIAVRKDIATMKRGRAEAALGRAAEQFSRLERSASEMKTDSKPEDDHDRWRRSWNIVVRRDILRQQRAFVTVQRESIATLKRSAVVAQKEVRKRAVVAQRLCSNPQVQLRCKRLARDLTGTILAAEAAKRQRDLESMRTKWLLDKQVSVFPSVPFLAGQQPDVRKGGLGGTAAATGATPGAAEAPVSGAVAVTLPFVAEEHANVLLCQPNKFESEVLASFGRQLLLFITQSSPDMLDRADKEGRHGTSLHDDEYEHPPHACLRTQMRLTLALQAACDHPWLVAPPRYPSLALMTMLATTRALQSVAAPSNDASPSGPHYEFAARDMTLRSLDGAILSDAPTAVLYCCRDHGRGRCRAVIGSMLHDSTATVLAIGFEVVRSFVHWALCRLVDGKLPGLSVESLSPLFSGKPSIWAHLCDWHMLPPLPSVASYPDSSTAACTIVLHPALYLAQARYSVELPILRIFTHPVWAGLVARRLHVATHVAECCSPWDALPSSLPPFPSPLPAIGRIELSHESSKLACLDRLISQLDAGISSASCAFSTTAPSHYPTLLLVYASCPSARSILTRHFAFRGVPAVVLPDVSPPNLRPAALLELRALLISRSAVAGTRGILADGTGPRGKYGPVVLLLPHAPAGPPLNILALLESTVRGALAARHLPAIASAYACNAAATGAASPLTALFYDFAFSCAYGSGPAALLAHTLYPRTTVSGSSASELSSASLFPTYLLRVMYLVGTTRQDFDDVAHARFSLQNAHRVDLACTAPAIDLRLLRQALVFEQLAASSKTPCLSLPAASGSICGTETTHASKVHQPDSVQMIYRTLLVEARLVATRARSRANWEAVVHCARQAASSGLHLKGATHPRADGDIANEMGRRAPESKRACR